MISNPSSCINPYSMAINEKVAIKFDQPTGFGWDLNLRSVAFLLWRLDILPSIHDYREDLRNLQFRGVFTCYLTFCDSEKGA